MAKITQKALTWSLNHLTKDRDTDLFPQLFEFSAIGRFKNEVFTALEKVDITNYPWSQGRRFVVPRGTKRYRAATQLDPIDSLMISALIHDVAPQIEAARLAIGTKRVFSYRVDINDGGRLYSEPSGWRSFWQESATRAASAGTVLVIDVRDFYNQIYHHTIENELKGCGVSVDYSKAIVGCLARQSHSVSRGIPVGPHFTHILAELCLNPIDRALLANGLDFCRYADDYHIFCKSRVDAEIALVKCVETFDKQQRLALNESKTDIVEGKVFAERAASITQDRPINADENKLLAVIRKYTDDDEYNTVTYTVVDHESLELVSDVKLTALVESYLSETPVNWSRLGWLLRRLRQIGAPGALRVVVENLPVLTPIIGDVARYILAAAPNFQADPRDLGARIVSLLADDRVRSSEYVSCVLLHLFAINAKLNHLDEITALWPVLTQAARREVLVAAARGSAHHWIRERKDDIDNSDPWSERALIVAISGLPDVEAKFWIKNKQPSLKGLNRLVAARFFDKKHSIGIGGDLVFP